MFPPVQCSKSSYFTQWLISEYLNRINNDSDQKPPPPPPPKNNGEPHSSSFSTKHLFPKQLNLFFSNHSSGSKTNNRANNNEYNGVNPPTSSSSSSSTSSPDSITIPKNIEFIQLLALNALEFTAPIYSFKKQDKKEQEVQETCKCPSTRSFVQLSGHPGSFAPAGPNTVWKKMPEDCSNCGVQQGLKQVLQQLGEPVLKEQKQNTTPITVFFNDQSPTSSSSSPPPLLPPQIYHIPTPLLPNECQVYRRVNSAHPPDPITLITPKYVTETCYNSQMFLELEDLLTNFSQPNPTIMDIKLGTRTFLESEVKNSKPRPDLYEKLIQVDRSACTESEHAEKAVTKLTYMMFREKQSSSNSLGFRVEGVKIGDSANYSLDKQVHVNFKFLIHEREIEDVFKRFCKGDRKLINDCVNRLQFIRETLQSSEFFMTHEVIGSSLLFIHDDIHVGVWMIDFAKTFEVKKQLSHRSEWVMGNREDGVLTGVDNIVRMFTKLLPS